MKQKITITAIALLLSLSTVWGQMNGTYYVGPDLTDDYQTIGAAVKALELQGVDGSVTIIVKNGTYDEQITIPIIAGVSSVNAITFTTQTREKPTIRFNATAVDENYVVKFDGAERILFENINLESTGSSFANVVVMEGGTKYVALSGLNITVNSSANADAVTINDVDAEYIGISNCSIRNGFNGILMVGSNSNKIENITISNNRIHNSKKACIAANKVANIEIYGNYLINEDVQPAFYQGMHLINVYDYSIFQNSLSLTRSIGINLSYCAQSNTKAYIANNIISIRGDEDNTNDYGIHIENGGRQEIYYNTIILGEEADNSAGIYFRDASGSGTNNSIINNNIVNLAGGYAIHVADQDAGIIATLDYNNLYTSGANLGNYHGTAVADLASWQSTSGFDANSISIDPLFTDTTYTISCNENLDSIANPLWVTDDYYGNSRNVTNPDVGAVEFDRVLVDLGADTVKNCSGESITLDAGELKNVSYNWSDGNTTQAITVSDENLYKVDVIHPCTTQTDSVFVDVIDVPDNLDLSDTTEICFGESSQLQVPLFEEASYSWSSGQISNSIQVSIENLYKVTVSNSCATVSDSTYLKVKDCTTGIYNKNLDNFVLFPNPTRDRFSLEVENRTPSEISIFRLDGTLYKKYRNSNQNSQIDCSDWERGIYHIIVKTGNTVQARRLILM